MTTPRKRTDWSQVEAMTVTGLQWGDEGKGKVIDALAEQADWVIRFQGGHNAGHTLVKDEQVFKLSLLPSGVLHSKCGLLIGSGVVIDPQALAKELAHLRAVGVDQPERRLKVASNCAIILPIHRALDAAQEQLRGTDRLGTTHKGIGPAYEDAVGRRAIKVSELDDEPTLKARLDQLVQVHEPFLRQQGMNCPTQAAMYQFVCQHRDLLLERQVDISGFYHHDVKAGHRLLFEGAQGAMLDVVHGTYPYVTSSATLSSAASYGAGFGGQSRPIGVVKAYTSRVGFGPFPTELNDQIGAYLQKQGQEKGTVTGRLRRCGWLDLVALRQAIDLTGVKQLVITKLDVLDYLAEIKLCTGYYQNGKRIDHLPTRGQDLSLEYQTLSGWQESTANATQLSALPGAAQRYLATISQTVGCEILAVSTGAGRQAMIWQQQPWQSR